MCDWLLFKVINLWDYKSLGFPDSFYLNLLTNQRFETLVLPLKYYTQLTTYLKQ
jgi:hypothetical protein